VLFFCFFFSSRRRHTRLVSDWRSDVCSSDLSCGHVAWARAGATGAVDCALLCVADGMGGMEAGEVASQTALGVVLRAAGRALTSSAMPQPDAPHQPEASHEADGAAMGAGFDPVALIREAATAVHAAADGRNLGTTITCVVVQDGTLAL